MAKHDKTLAKLQRSPPASDLKWNDLKSLLGSLGYVMLKGSGSRRKFYNEERNLLISCHEPHPQPDVDRGCAADIIEHLRKNGVIG